MFLRIKSSNFKIVRGIFDGDFCKYENEDEVMWLKNISNINTQYRDSTVSILWISVKFNRIF